MLALVTDDCARFHLSLFEPDSGELRTISDAPDEMVVDHAWRPGGAAIAVGVVYSGESQAEPRAEVVLVAVPEAVLATDSLFPRRTLASISLPRFLVPERWNADGSKLLVRYFEERDMCRDGAGVTEVEVIGP